MVSSSSDAANHGSSGKIPLQGSSRELSTDHTVDGIDDGINDDVVSESFPRAAGSTHLDKREMWRMGKKQELNRNFFPLSALSFTIVLQATWEFYLTANTQGLVDGGRAGLFWSYIWTFLGFGVISASLAEMASMAPTCGGQYHWVSEFAPLRYQKFMSYMTGWMSTLSWQAGNASGSFLSGTIIQGLITVNNPNYQPTNWQGTLLVFAMVSLVFISNTWGARIVPGAQTLLLVVHVSGFLAIIIVLWALAPKTPAKVVFTQFSNRGGWSNIGVSLMIGQISAIFGLTCSDGAAHMSEEIKDAGLMVPRAIMGSYVFNGFMGLVLLIAYIFCIPSVDDALSDPSAYPFLYVFRNAVSVAGVNALTAVVLFLLVASNISFNLSTSRQTWSFARDGGLPFSRWISYVHPGLQIPTNAIGLSCLISVLLSLINLGSSAAFNAMASLQLVALLLTYIISISCVLHRRLHNPKSLPQCRWSLGRFGVAINIGGLAYAVFAFFWCFWPNGTPVNPSTFNWSVAIFTGVILVSLVMYWVKGRATFDGPVVLVRRD